MYTREHTLHGYDSINFPDKGSSLKKFLGTKTPYLVKFKTFLFDSGTSKNK
jgi:hypothetical protein